MRRIAILFFGAAVALVAAGSAVEVYSAGTGGYHTYRIPALLATKRGTLLAFCEGRKNSAADAGNIDMMLRRSQDGGKTWSPAKVVYEDGGDAPITIGNPAPVQDRKTGTIHLLFTRNNERLFITSSDDDGLTWSALRELTDSIRPFDYTWTRVATGPGHAIQLKSGRLLIPMWLNDRPHKTYRSAAIYSDDGGRTWKTGGIVKDVEPNFNECMFRERSDGAVQVNLRSGAHYRYTAISRDGGMTWSEPKPAEALPDPVCQASVLSAGGRRAVFANAADPQKRRNLTLRLSEDDGETWIKSQTITEGPSAYSDLARDRRGDILVLFEAGEKTSRDSIRFVRVPGRWLGR
jgi:sialidase-1